MFNSSRGGGTTVAPTGFLCHGISGHLRLSVEIIYRTRDISIVDFPADCYNPERLTAACFIQVSAGGAMPIQNEKRATLGKIGLGLSLVPWLAIAILMILRPG
jgi:hypothetical protein